MSVKDQIRPAVEGPLGALGLLVEDVSVTPAGRRRLVRIWIDRAVDDTGPDTTTATEPLSLDEVADALGPDRLWSFSTRARRPYTEASFRPGDALVFGPESRGLPARWLAEAEHAGRAVRIPIHPEARSLNLSSAVAIGLFEAARQVDGPSSGPAIVPD